MRIAIDATSIPPKPAGAGVYAIELVRALSERKPHDGYAAFARGPWFDAMLAAKRNWRVQRVTAESRVSRLLWEQMRFPGALESLGIDVVHSTHHTLPLLPMPSKKVVTIHDVTFFLIPRRYPPARRYYMQIMTRLAARVAQAIIVPSQTVRDDVIRALPASADKVTVVYEAAAADYRPIDPVEARAVACRYGLDEPYLLSVGSLEPGKNRGRLIRALRALRDDGVDAQLFIAGQPAWNFAADEQLVREFAMQDRVIFGGYVPREDLPALHSASLAFVFPSLYEGFGLPVMEAMACGAPVLTSNVSATAEVAGEAAVLVQAHSVDSIRDGIRRLITDADLRHALSAAGIKRASEFSWRRAADETHAVYARALGGRAS